MFLVPLILTFAIIGLCFADVDFDAIGYFLMKFFFVLVVLLISIALMLAIIALPTVLGLTGIYAVALTLFMFLVLVSALIVSVA